MIDRETCRGKVVTVTATDGDGDRIHAEEQGAEVWLTVRASDGDFHQVRLVRADAKQFAEAVVELASSSR